MNAPKLDLSILIPTFNEADIIDHALREIAKALGNELSGKTEILIADDGKDALPAIILALGKSLPFYSIEVMRNTPAIGKGASLARCFLAARGDIVGFLDADLSTSPTYIHDAIKVIQSGRADIFIASRHSKGSDMVREQHPLKTVLGDVLRYGINWMIFRTGKKYSDTQCGFKFFKNDQAKILWKNLIANDGLADIEVLVRANILGLKVHEAPVVWKDIRESKRSLKRILAHELKSISQVLYHYGVLGHKQRNHLRNKNREAS